MRFHRILLLGVSGAQLIGCASVDPKIGFEEVQHLVSSRISQKIEWNQENSDEERVQTAVRVLLEQELTLSGAVQIALLNNPELQASYERLGIAQAELVQAGLLSNPVFDAELHFRGGGIGAGSTLGIVENFISIFQQPLQKRVAKSALQQTKLELGHAVLDTVGRVKSAFVTLQGARKSLQMRRLENSTLEAAMEVARRQHEAGNITALDYAIQRSQHAKATLEIKDNEAEVAQARERMNLLLGLWGQDGATWKVSEELAHPDQFDADCTKLEELAIENRLDLQAMRQEIQARGEKLGITESFRLVPDLGLGAFVEGEGKSAVVPGARAQFQLPIFDWGLGRVERDKAALRESQKRYYALSLRIRSEVRAAFAKLQAARSKVEFIDASLIPISKQITKEAQLHYNAMQLGVYNLLKAKQDEFEARNSFTSAVTDYWLARIELELAVGGSFCPSSERSNPT